MNKLKKHKTILITLVIFIIIISVVLFVVQSHNKENQNGKQFNPDSCTSFSAEECPDSCVVCPPCEVCSSISCQSEEFCESIGFNKTWAKEVMK